MLKKVIAIVGMGKGISYAVAEKFSAEDYFVAMIARSEEKLKGYQKKLKESGYDSYYYVADASEEESLKSAFKTLKSDLDKVDVLLYNTASLKKKNILDETTDSLIYDFKVNVIGALLSVNEVIPEMKENDEGTILFTGGGLSMFPNHNYGSLAIGKAGIKNLTQSVTQALKLTNIKVGTITINGFVSADDKKYNPKVIAEKFWNIHKTMKSGTDIIY